MAKIQRVTGKVFGGTATATGADPQIGQFGSALAGTYLGTTDISTIQQLPAWGQGFIGAVTTDNQFPALPEVTGFGKVLSQQQCYLLQQGVAEWDNGTTYYTGSFCSKGGLLYVSTIDENLNNDPESDFLNWSLYAGGTSAYIGQTVFSLLPIVDAGVHLLDGTLLNGDGIYSGFVNYIASIYDASASYFCTEEDWQASVSQYGVCGKFVYDSTNNTVRLPKVTGIVEGTIDANALGDLVQAGLPTHTHTRGTMNITGSFDNSGRAYASTAPTGAFYTKATGQPSNQNVDNVGYTYGFEASRSWTGSTSTGNYSSSIQSSDTVQPQTIKGYYYIVVATSTKTDIEVDIDNVATDLNRISTSCQVLEDTALKENQITNCLLEVPQNIKLELNNGTLTLKAGSKVIVPNGFEANGTTPKFDYISINENLDVIQNTPTSTKQALLFVDADGKLWIMRSELCFSGETKPTVDNAWMAWYDTTNHVINLYASLTDHNTVTTTLSLPFAIATPKGDGTYHITSIDQIFNGMGYIGSTTWIDKGVKMLLTNGRNEDGTLNNTVITTDKMNVRTMAYSGEQSHYVFWLNYTDSSIYSTWGGQYIVSETEPNHSDASQYIMWYNPVTNLFKQSNAGGEFFDLQATYIGICEKAVTGNITQFKPKEAFRAVDYNDKSEISGWGMPSDKYIDLTLGASGTTYTAPANGYYYVNKIASGEQYLRLTNSTSNIAIEMRVVRSGEALATYIPVKKGDVCTVRYDAGGETNSFRFIYAQGEV